MKRLILGALALVLFAGVAKAVDDMTVLRPLRSYGFWATTSAGVARDNTGNFISSAGVEVIRVLAAQDVFISFEASAPSGSAQLTPVATKVTGFLVPASTPVIFRMTGRNMFSVIASTAAGGVHITEMGK